MQVPSSALMSEVRLAALMKAFTCRALMPDLLLAALNKYLPKPRNKTGVNLLATSQAEQEEARKQGLVDKEKPREYLSYLKPSVSIALLDDATAYPANAVPDHVCSSLVPGLSSSADRQFAIGQL